jgi:hypothetical protein
MFACRILCALFALYLSVTLLSQSDRGTLTGTVSDPQNAVVQNTRVVATNSATGASNRVSMASASLEIKRISPPLTRSLLQPSLPVEYHGNRRLVLDLFRLDIHEESPVGRDVPIRAPRKSDGWARQGGLEQWLR